MFNFIKNLFPKPATPKKPNEVVADRYLAATKHYLDPNPIKRYHYEALDRCGREIKGTISGHSEYEALQKVREEGGFPTCIKPFEGQEEIKAKIPDNTYLDIQERLLNELTEEERKNLEKTGHSKSIEEVAKSIKFNLPATVTNEKQYVIINVNNSFGTIFAALETLRTSNAVPEVTRKSLTRIKDELRTIHERCGKEIEKKFQTKPLQSVIGNDKIMVTKSTKKKKGK